MSQVSITTYDDKFLRDYIELNREWIQKFFVIEPMDIAQLEQAKENILDVGGEIFFVVESDSVAGAEAKAVGACAMTPMPDGGYELAKMAIAPSTRGKGYGSLLIDHTIAWARAKSAKQFLLHSNTILEPAIALYKKHGFETVRLGPHPDYDRANIEMILKL